MSYTHLNQFHKPDGSAWGPPNYPWSHGDCWATAGAMGADDATDGKQTPTPPKIRALSGNKKLAGNVGDIKVALDKLGIESHIPRGGASWSLITRRLATGRWSACIATDYDQIPDDKSCQPSFDGDHMFFLPAGTQDAMGRIEADDPLCENTRKYDGTDIQAAARKCATHLGVPRLIVIFIKKQHAAVTPPTDPKDTEIADLKAKLADAQDTIADWIAYAEAIEAEPRPDQT